MYFQSFAAIATILAVSAAPAAAIVPSETDTRVTLERVEGEAEFESVTGFSNGEVVHFSHFRREVTVTAHRVEGGSFTPQEINEIGVIAVTCPGSEVSNWPDFTEVTHPATYVAIFTFECLSETP